MRVDVRTTWCLVLSGALGGALWACSSEGGSKQPGTLAELGIADGAEKGLINRVEVDGSSEIKVPLRTGAEIQLPKGAVADRVTIGIERPADDKALAMIEKLARPDRVLSAPYVLTPHGTKFLRDVTVTLPIAKMGDRNLQVAYLTDEKDADWEIIGVPTSGGKQASIALGHFSVLVLIESDEPAPDAGDELDAGVAEDVDAAQAPDTSVVADGSVMRDAAVDIDGNVIDAGVDAGLPSLYERYIECGFASAGMFVDRDPPEGPYEHCRRTCLRNPDTASCLDLQQDHCYHGDFEGSPQLADCYLACAPLVECAGGQGYQGARCNGYAECPDGEDETGCDPALQFVCPNDGGTISVTSRCDGYADCPGEQDELGCSRFVCPGTGTSIPHFRVCDGNPDCENTQNPEQSDEPSSCVQYECNIITQ